MSQSDFPPLTAEEFKEFVEMMRSKVDADAWHKAQVALATLDQRGMPDADSYSLMRIYAEDEEDLNLKLHLATAPVMKAFLEGKADESEIEKACMPLINKVSSLVLDSLFSDVEFPLTIEVTDD